MFHSLYLLLRNAVSHAIAALYDVRWSYQLRKLARKYQGAKNIPESELVDMMPVFDPYTLKLIRLSSVGDALTALVNVDILDTHYGQLIGLASNGVVTEPTDERELDWLMNTAKTGDDVLVYLVRSGDITEVKLNFFVSTPETQQTLADLRARSLDI